MRVRTFLVFLLLHSAAASVGAQTRGHAYVDLTVGANLSVGTVPLDRDSYRGGPTYLFVAFGNQPNANRPLVGALHLGINVVMGTHAACSEAPLGACLKDFPFGSLVAFTAGARPIRTPFELTAGPALVGSDARGTRLGLLVVGRVGFQPGHYLSPGVAMHFLAAPIDGAVAVAIGLGFSLRTW